MQSFHFFKKWRTHKKEYQTHEIDLNIGVAATVTAEPIEPYLGCYLLENGFQNPVINVAEFDQIHQICRNPLSCFPSKPDVICILWRLEDLTRENIEKTNQIKSALDDLMSSLKTLRQNFSGTIITNFPDYPNLPQLQPLDPASGLTDIQNFISLRTYWKESVKELSLLKFIDFFAITHELGRKKVYDHRKWYLYRQPWTEEYWQALATEIGRNIRLEYIPSKKCIVLDADNTLWGGITGEDGIEGIQLSNEFPGSAFKDFQKMLLSMKKNGVMLAVASKNNESDFFEVLDRHDEMILRRDDFLSFQIHWNSKVDSLKKIATDLNIGLDALVFIDDNPKEIAEVNDRLPEVVTFTVPEELSALPYIFKNTHLFDRNKLTEEDLNRTSMMQASQKRKQLEKNMSEEEFLSSLDLKMSIFRAKPQHIGRVTQLINKTNQFNLTTIRRTLEEVTNFSKSDNYDIIAMTLKDKYGEYGLVGVAIIDKKTDDFYIDTFLMSCRILGRKAETTFLNTLITYAKQSSAKTLRASYIETNKNMMVRDFYKDHGFHENQNFWYLDLKDTEIASTKVNIETDLY